MTNINFKVMTRPGFEPAGSGLEPTIFGFPDLPEQEAGDLLIRPPSLVFEFESMTSHTGNQPARFQIQQSRLVFIKEVCMTVTTYTTATLYNAAASD